MGIITGVFVGITISQPGCQTAGPKSASRNSNPIAETFRADILYIALLNPATGLMFGNEVIGPGGRTGLEIRTSTELPALSRATARRS